MIALCALKSLQEIEGVKEIATDVDSRRWLADKELELGCPLFFLFLSHLDAWRFDRGLVLRLVALDTKSTLDPSHLWWNSQLFRIDPKVVTTLDVLIVITRKTDGGQDYYVAAKQLACDRHFVIVLIHLCLFFANDAKVMTRLFTLLYNLAAFIPRGLGKPQMGTLEASLQRCLAGASAADAADDADDEPKMAATRTTAELFRTGLLKDGNSSGVTQWTLSLVPCLKNERTKWLGLWALSTVLSNLKAYRLDVGWLPMLPWDLTKELLRIFNDPQKSQRARKHAKVILDAMALFGDWNAVTPTEEILEITCIYMLWDVEHGLYQSDVTGKLLQMLSRNCRNLESSLRRILEILLEVFSRGITTNEVGSSMWILNFFRNLIEQDYWAAFLLFEFDCTLSWLIPLSKTYGDVGVLLRLMGGLDARVAAVAVKNGFVDFL